MGKRFKKHIAAYKHRGNTVVMRQATQREREKQRETERNREKQRETERAC